MKGLLNALKGKKTYLVALIAAVVVALHSVGYIDSDIANTLLSFLGLSGLVTLRASIK